MSAESPPPNLLLRFRRWVIWAIAIGAILYVGGSLWAGIEQTGAQLAAFPWLLMVPVLALTMVNYALRFLKWHYLLGRVGVKVGWVEDATWFLAGLAMVISPGKAGELLKPWLASRRSGVAMVTTIPALVTERLTDGIAVLGLAAISVGTYAGDRVIYVAAPSAVLLVGIGVLMHEGLSTRIVDLLGLLPIVSRFIPRVRVMLHALRVTLEPGPLLGMVLLSVVAWWAECVGYWLVLHGFGIEASLDASTFLYAFATVAGGAMPGGLGVADGALAGGAMTIAGAPEAAAVASALLIRLATLWIGVFMGAVALFRVGGELEAPPPSES